MKKYKLIQGWTGNIETFNEQVSIALEGGWVLAGQLVVDRSTFYQPMVNFESN